MPKIELSFSVANVGLRMLNGLLLILSSLIRVKHNLGNVCATDLPWFWLNVLADQHSK